MTLEESNSLFAPFRAPSATEYLAVAGSEYVHDFEPGIYVAALPGSDQTEQLDNLVLVERKAPFVREQSVRVDLDSLSDVDWLERAGVSQIGSRSLSAMPSNVSRDLGLHVTLDNAAASECIGFAASCTAGSLALRPSIFSGIQNELLLALPDLSADFRILGVDLTSEPTAATAVGRATLACRWTKRILEAASAHSGMAEAAATRLSFVFPTSSALWIEVAFLRATRILVSQILTQYGIDGSRVSPLITLMVAPDANELPEQRLIRYSAAACAAFLGECDMVSAPGMRVLSEGTLADSQRLLASTQLMLIHEARLGELRDPVAGSIYVESLTTRIGRAAWAEYQHAPEFNHRTSSSVRPD